MKFNQDYKLRDSILFDDGYQANQYRGGGIRYFSLASVDQITKLMEAGFLDPDDRQNESPTSAEFLEFMQEYPGFTAHGYVISPERDDCRVTIEGLCKVTKDGDIPEAEQEKFNWFRDADDFCCTSRECYCWYD